MSPEQLAQELRLARDRSTAGSTTDRATLLALADLAVSMLRMIDERRERGVRFDDSYNEDVLRIAVEPLAAQEFPPGPPMRPPLQGL
jgi:hypothetical protein